jgi:hypothetical protein
MNNNTSVKSVPIAIRIPTDVYKVLEKRARSARNLTEEEVRRGVNIRARKIITDAIRRDIGRKR